MKSLLLAALPILAIEGCLIGCTAEGERRLEIEFFGSKVAIVDTVEPNAEGERIYRAGFDPRVMDWFLTPAESEESAKTEEEDEPPTP